MINKYTTWTVFFLGINILILSNFCFAQSNLPVAFQSTYSLSHENSVIGEMKRSLSKQDDQYHFRSSSRATGLLSLFYKDNMTEETRWIMQGTEFKPLSYSFHRNRKNKERKVNIIFDWEDLRIITSVNGAEWYMPLDMNIYDKLLYQIVIMHDLKQGKTIDKFSVADGGKIKTYRFERIGFEMVNTPLGKFKTIKLERYKSNDDSKLSLWCAEVLNYLPIKVESIDKDGKNVTALIKEYKEN